MALEYIKSWAWDFLIRCEIYELPINAVNLREKNLGFDIMSYQEGKEQIKLINKEDYAKQHAAFIANIDGDTVIFYNENLCMADRNLSITHEIGHFVCGHTENGNIIGKYNFDTPIYNVQQEVEATIFETAFLAPAPILLEMGVKTATEISRITLLPEHEARNIIEDIKKEAAIRQSVGVVAKLSETFHSFIVNYKHEGEEKMIEKKESERIEKVQVEDPSRVVERIYIPSPPPKKIIK